MDRPEPWQELYWQGRPVWGPHLYDLETLAEIRTAIQDAAAPVQATGGVLLLPAAPEAELSALHLLSLLAGSLRWQGQVVAFSQFLAEPYLQLPDPVVSCWLIHQAHLFPNLRLCLETWLQPGRLAVVTGPAEYWEANPLPVPVVTATAFVDYLQPVEQLLADFARQEDLLLQEIQQNLTADPHTLRRQAHHWVCLTEAWGVPLPLALLAALLQVDEDRLGEAVEEAYQQGILFWVEREKPPALLVASRGSGYARRYLQEQVSCHGLTLEQYQALFTACHPEEREERYTLLKLLQSWLAQSRNRWSLGFHCAQMRELVARHWPRLRELVRAGSAAEALLWGQCLGRLGLFAKAQEIFTAALRREPRNPFLLQAQAHLLAKWSQGDPRQAEAAAAAFAAACQAVPHNVYLWQARGVFEAERRNRHGAETCFAKALNLDPGNLPTLTARADMYLESGDWDKAEQDLQRAQKLAPNNIYTLHLLGRWHFYRGEWTAAQESWQQLLHLDRRSLYAFQSLGHLARRRGRTQEAAAYLAQALDLDPENTAVLLELTLLHLADPAAGDQAAAYLERALAVEPANPKLLVSRAHLLLEQGDAARAREELEHFLARHPENIPAWHILGRTFLALGQPEEMAKAFQKIVQLSRGRNLQVYLTWAESARHLGRREEAGRLLTTALAVYRDYGATWPASDRFDGLLALARLAEALGWEVEAAAARREAEQLDPEHPALAPAP